MYLPLQINQLNLKRYPKTQDKSLRAWNAADELLIDYIQSHCLTLGTQRDLNCLIVNDQFGALTASLDQFSPTFWTDSFLSQRAIVSNLEANFGQNKKAKQFIPSFDMENNDRPTENHKQTVAFDLVLIRVAKHNSLMEFQLNHIKPWLNKNTLIVAGGMTKEIHNTNIKLFETILGKTTTSLAKKKARLIFSQFEHSNQQQLTSKRYFLEKYQLNIFGLPGVFSRDKLDIGTQVLLDYLPKLEIGQKVIDLGCGNGVLGAIMAKTQPNCEVYLTDESELAVESAKLTFQQNNLSNGHFYQTDVLEGLPTGHFDHVLCNPPFHQQNVQTLDIANNMFKQSALCLRPSGELRVVANRHLKYQSMLSQYFNHVSSISNNNKFTVWSAKSKKL